MLMRGASRSAVDFWNIKGYTFLIMLGLQSSCIFHKKKSSRHHQATVLSRKQEKILYDEVVFEQTSTSNLITWAEFILKSSPFLSILKTADNMQNYFAEEVLCAYI